MNETPDVLDVVRRYAPNPVSLAPEWTLEHDAELLAEIVGGAQEADVLPLVFSHRPVRRRRRTWLLPIGAGAAVLALMTGVVVAVLPGSRSPAPAGNTVGPVLAPPPGLSNRADVGAHQWSYRVIEQIALNASGRPDPHSDFAMTMRDVIAPNADLISRRTGQQTGCFSFGPDSPNGSIEQPTRAFFASLPTHVTQLQAYLRSHTGGGSSTADHAVFVAVGDALREYGALASPRLRAALVAVLSRTPGVTVHRGQRDQLGRAALRADFVDQRIEPGAISSLYFDPTSFRMLEERDGSNGEPSRYSGPSPAYGGHGEKGFDPVRLGLPAWITVIRVDQVISTPPTKCR